MDEVKEVHCTKAISEKDARRIIMDHVQWSHFECEGGENTDIILIHESPLCEKQWKLRNIYITVWKTTFNLAYWVNLGMYVSEE